MTKATITTVNGLHVESAGNAAGGTLLLIHGSLTADGCRPLLSDAPLIARMRVIHYYRRGYRQSATSGSSMSLFDHAADARMVLGALGVTRAHVLGHSIGALIALELALAWPEMVRSLALIEPTWPSRPELLPWFESAIAPTVEAYGAGDRSLAADRLLRLIDGDRYRESFSTAFGSGWFEAIAASLDIYFGAELPATASWSLSPEMASRLAQPALVLRGAATLPQFSQVCDDTISLLPDVRVAVIDRARHNVIAHNAPDSVRVLSEFLARDR